MTSQLEGLDVRINKLLQLIQKGHAVGDDARRPGIHTSRMNGKTKEKWSIIHGDAKSAIAQTTWAEGKMLCLEKLWGELKEELLLLFQGPHMDACEEAENTGRVQDSNHSNDSSIEWS